MLEMLSEDERERAARFRFERHRTQYILSRGALRILIGRYLRIDPGEAKFQHNEYGKPYLDSRYHHDSTLEFSLAHSGDLTVFAFARDSAIGVDCEFVRSVPDAEEIAARFFSQWEDDVLKSLPEDQKTAAFYSCWTRKEAYIKAMGLGLSMPLDRFAVSIKPEEPAQLIHIDGSASEAAKWAVKSWEPKTGYIAAVACKCADPRWRFYQIPEVNESLNEG
ncbi:MAG: 4'-phosphopantetheinyl transferase family protein [Candidatus Promineifilaceae bacterium]